MVASRYIVGFIVSTLMVLIALWWGFANFHQEIYNFLKMESSYTVLFDEVGVTVTVADDPASWQQGLSGVESLGELEGKLFVFEKTDNYGFWMKDMLFPIDIIWIDENFTVVHIEERVQPESYPKTYSSPVLARYVLEVNAAFVESFKIEVGSRVRLPSAFVPEDLQK